MLILPMLKASAKEFSIQPHLMIVSSDINAMTKSPEWKQSNTFDVLDGGSKARISERYSTSKLLEVLFVRQIALKLAASGVILNMLNTGLCHSELARDGGRRMAIMKTLLVRATEEGSRTLGAAAVAGPESHGRYKTDAKVNNGAISDFAKSEEWE
jgi:NAD(P)-dependent dehydrogenase (short-subunit alcohol dehydrogenase family)